VAREAGVLHCYDHVGNWVHSVVRRTTR
jgi:hypothetical protein